jgi:hypothetical protein
MQARREIFELKPGHLQWWSIHDIGLYFFEQCLWQPQSLVRTKLALETITYICEDLCESWNKQKTKIFIGVMFNYDSP